MNNKYTDLVEIIKKSRENIRPALQGDIFEREMLGSEVLRGEEAKMRALEEIKQRPQVKIVDEEKKAPVVDDEVKVMDDDEVEDKFENDTIDISKLRLTPKTSFKALKSKGVGQKYFVIDTDPKGEKRIIIFEKQTRKGIEPSVDKDDVDSMIPLIRDRIPLDVGKRQLDKFTSLLRKGKVRDALNKQISDYFEVKGKGHDPRLLLGSFLAKNNNEELRNLVMSKILRY
jgi:hypothetical protein